jgi:hypothetical protein
MDAMDVYVAFRMAFLDAPDVRLALRDRDRMDGIGIEVRARSVMEGPPLLPGRRQGVAGQCLVTRYEMFCDERMVARKAVEFRRAYRRYVDRQWARARAAQDVGAGV